MNKMLKVGFVIAVLGGTVSLAQENILVDDFTTTLVGENSRLRLDYLDGNDEGNDWVKHASSEWKIENGELSNAATTAGIPAEGLIGRLVSTGGLTAGATIIELSFDYVIDSGSTLHYACWGITTNGTPSSNAYAVQLANTQGVGGAIQADKAEGEYGDIDIITGADMEQTPGHTLTGSGIFKQTIDLTTYTWDDNVVSDTIASEADGTPPLAGYLTDVKDLEIIILTFASDVETLGATTTIKNLKLVTVPPPPVVSLISIKK